MYQFLKGLLPRLSLGLVGAGRGGAAEGTALSTTGVREGKSGSQVTTQAHGKYYEASSRGQLYSAVTSAARALTTGLSTTGPFTLYNPAGSGKNLALKKVGFAQGATGTLGTGGMFHTVYSLKSSPANQTGTAPTGTAITPVPGLVAGANSSVATPLEAVTFAVAPVAMYAFLNQSEVAGGTIGDNSVPNSEDVNGAIVLPPGTGWAPQSISAAGSSPLGWFSVIWEETPIT